MTQKSVLIVGATRGTGLEIARILSARGDEVIALVRPGPSRMELRKLEVRIFEGDAFDRESLDAVFQATPIDAVITSLGGKRGEPRVDVPGTQNIVAAAKDANVSRYLMLGAIGTGDSWEALSPKGQEVLGAVMKEKTVAEDSLIESGLDYTIIRGGALSDDPATGNAFLTEDNTLIGTVTRKDWAGLVVDCLDDPETSHRKIYAALDREMIGQTFF